MWYFLEFPLLSIYFNVGYLPEDICPFMTDEEFDLSKRSELAMFWKRMHLIMPERSYTSIKDHVQKELFKELVAKKKLRNKKKKSYILQYRNPSGRIRWTEENMKRFLELKEQYPKQWGKIGRIMGVRNDLLFNLLRIKSGNRGKMTEEEGNKVIKLVLAQNGLKELPLDDEEKFRKMKINWAIIERAFEGERNNHFLFTWWQTTFRRYFGGFLDF